MVRAGQRSGYLLVLLRALSLTHPHARAAGKPHAARRPRPKPLWCTARAEGIATSRSYLIWRHAGLKIGSHSMTALAARQRLLAVSMDLLCRSLGAGPAGAGAMPGLAGEEVRDDRRGGFWVDVVTLARQAG